MERLTIEDLLLIAEAVLDVPAERLARATRLGAAASALAAPFAAVGDHGPDRYPSLADKAAVLCSRLIRNQPFPDGNKRVALVAMLELVARNHGVWLPSEEGEDELAATIERLALRELTEARFAAWMRGRVTTR